jgi:hypothetical protein
VRHAIVLLAVLGGLSPLRAQRSTEMTVTVVNQGGLGAELAVRALFADDQFPAAMEAGFPLYLEFRMELREKRSLWDRTATAVKWERVVLYDPVRDRYVVEDADGTEIVKEREALERRLAGPWRVPMEPAKPGRFYYKAVLIARTLSDEDVDEVFAWLKGDPVDSLRRERPGFIARTARRLLVQVAPLPTMTVEAKSPTFSYP